MTNNIVAQFSCSIDRNGNPIEYRVVNGSNFSEEYNETLDSGTILISQVPLSKRIVKMGVYIFVRVFDKSGNTNFDKIFLLDDFNEKEINIKEHIFDYTVKLMSETKLLEKVQCPNRTITHNLNVNGNVEKKTIFDYIVQYMKMYVPKVKFSSDGETWSYVPLIKVPGVEEDRLTYSGNMVIAYDNNDFVLSGAFPDITFWKFNFETDQLPNTIDYDTVIFKEIVMGDSNADWYEDNPTCEYDPQTGRFNLSGLAHEPGDGLLQINYTYKKKPVIDTNTDFYRRFNVPCADMNFSAPTLRQLLTTIMQQVGCIPIVRNRVLGFLDFQKNAVAFGNGDYTLGNTVNLIIRSLSSDSYANTLVNMSEQVLDSGNEVICETLGFRDKSNVLLKQQENLKLETSLPIFKVNKCILHAPGKMEVGFLGSNLGCCSIVTNYSDYPTGYNLDNHPWPIIFYGETTVDLGRVSMKFRLSENISDPNFTVRVNKFCYLNRETGKRKYFTVKEKEPFSFSLNNQTLTSGDTIVFPDAHDQNYNSFTSKSYTLTITNEGILSYVGFLISGVFVNNTTGTSKPFTFVRFDKLDTSIECRSVWHAGPWERQSGTWNQSDQEWFANLSYARSKMDGIAGFQTWDISKLVVENSARQALETNFYKMWHDDITGPDVANIEKLSKYVYGTVGYSIGSKEISGFSEVLVAGEGSPLGWIEKNYTYIENIVNCLEKGGTAPISLLAYNYMDVLEDPDVFKVSGKETSATGLKIYESCNFVDFDFKCYDAGTDTFNSNKKFFTSFFFDLYYQPLNSFNLSYVKEDEDIDFAIEQYDSNASGVTDFDRLSTHEQEQVNRIGQTVLSINQRTNDYDDIQNFENGPLFFRDDLSRNGVIDGEELENEYIIFKRSFTIKNNCFNVSYVGSKASILKDYFTSIRTKYRAYQYVDYSSSILRKEKDLMFIRIAQNIYDGDDKVRLGNLSNNFIGKIYNDLAYLKYFIYDFSQEAVKPISYELEIGKGIISDGLNQSIIQEQKVKNGVSLISTKNMLSLIYEYIDNVGAGTYINDITNDQDLGGIPQTWQIWSEEHNEKHRVYFVDSIDYYSKLIVVSGTDEELKEQIADIECSPVVKFPYTTVMWITDDNYSNERDKGKLFAKDAAERINHTVEFIYYAPNKDVLLSERFISATPMIGRHELPFNACYGSDEFKINDLPHDLPTGDDSLPLNRITLRVNDNGIPYVKVLFSGFSCIKMCYKNPETNEIIDIAVFKNGSGNINKDFYFMINDTKSDYVLSDYHGILYRKYKVTTYEQAEPGITGYVLVSDLFPRTVEPIYDEED